MSTVLTTRCVQARRTGGARPGGRSVVRAAARTEAAAASPSSTSRATPLSRRGALLAKSAPFAAWLLAGGSAQARGMDAYIKKKGMEPLDSYVPPVLAARDQLDGTLPLLGDPANAEDVRQMMRKGPFSGLRDNIRVLGLNAAKSGRGDSSDLVGGFFSALQAYDAALFQTTRSEGGPYPEGIREKAEAAIAALDKVLATVPEEMLAKSRRVLDVLDSTEESDAPTTAPQNLDLLF
eukprot:jgi/Tetstr1/459277/TSEL_004677.t1